MLVFGDEPQGGSGGFERERDLIDEGFEDLLGLTASAMADVTRIRRSERNAAAARASSMRLRSVTSRVKQRVCTNSPFLP